MRASPAFVTRAYGRGVVAQCRVTLSLRTNRTPAHTGRIDDQRHLPRCPRNNPSYETLPDCREAREPALTTHWRINICTPQQHPRALYESITGPSLPL
jgi:hypothetical protein